MFIRKDGCMQIMQMFIPEIIPSVGQGFKLKLVQMFDALIVPTPYIQTQIFY
jgi:hypothetical protein